MNDFTQIVVCMSLVGIAQFSIAQEGRITVRVADETGQVISNAVIEAYFHRLSSPGWGWGASASPNVVKGNTDMNGQCILTGEGNAGDLAVAALKDGYYGSGGYEVFFTNVTGFIARKWQPWNPVVEVVLKRVGTPIPMYAKQMLYAKIPADGEPVGFDLMAGDWVAPHGNGDTSDFVLLYKVESEETVETRYGPTKTSERTLAVTFSNDGDGVIDIVAPVRGGSALRLPPTAPKNDYATNIVKRVVADQQGLHSDIREDQNYFFRVRTKKDDEGNIVSALYGKMHGDFQFDHLGQVTFTYYLNPTPNDRNVEFDPKKNLFRNLTPSEQVREP